MNDSGDAPGPSRPTARWLEERSFPLNDQIIDASDYSPRAAADGGKARPDERGAEEQAERQKRTCLRDMSTSNCAVSRGKELDINVDAGCDPAAGRRSASRTSSTRWRDLEKAVPPVSISYETSRRTSRTASSPIRWWARSGPDAAADGQAGAGLLRSAQAGVRTAGAVCG